MAMIEVQLGAGAGRGTRLRLRSLRGSDETMAGERDAFAATRLLERLLLDAGGAPAEADAVWRLPLHDRDRLLAELYRHHFGDAIETTVACDACGETFEVRFSLEALVRRLDEERSGAGVPDEAGIYTLPDGLRFRLPTAADQRAVAALPAEEAAAALLRRCVLGGEADEAAADEAVADDAPVAVDAEPVDTPEAVAAIEAAMEQAGPVLDQDLPASCPHCEREQVLRFDIQDHLLAALQHERTFLVREVHCLASAYGWSLDEILALPRAERREYVRLIQADGRRRP